MLRSMLALLTVLVVSSVGISDIRPLLRQQGFSGPLNGREMIKYVGDIPQGRNDYQVYLYHGTFRAAAVDHGVNRLIVIVNGSTFVGAYDTSMPTDCKVRGRKVVCTNGTIEFTGRGPPREILFDGEIEHIAYGNTLKK